MRNSGLKLVGHIDVDAGLCWVGDPCYIVASKDLRWDDWGDFCRELFAKRESQQVHSFAHNKGHGGMGVAVSTGYGDGTYPVYVRYGDEGRAMEVRVVFDEAGEDEDEQG